MSERKLGTVHIECCCRPAGEVGIKKWGIGWPGQFFIRFLLDEQFGTPGRWLVSVPFRATAINRQRRSKFLSIGTCSRDGIEQLMQHIGAIESILNGVTGQGIYR